MALNNNMIKVTRSTQKMQIQQVISWMVSAEDALCLMTISFSDLGNKMVAGK